MSLTKERVMQLPAAQRAAWLEYLKRSQTQMAADKAALAAERAGLVAVPELPKQSFSARTIPLHRAADFYASDEAKHIGDVVLSFQTPAGGWSKNLDMSGAARLPGQSFTTGNLAPVEGQEGDFDKPVDAAWHYVGTLDNDSTNTELHFLAELAAALPGHDGDKYRAAALRGFEYLLRAQYPNGGWPQVWPLEGGYHDAITFNDDAVTESAETLTAVAGGARVTSEPEVMDPEMVAMMERMGRKVPEQHAVTEDYSFVPAAMRSRAKAAVAKALECILATQIRVEAPAGKGKVLAIWGQQYDPLTEDPSSARNYEMPSLASGESASVLEYLMALPHPSPAVVRAVNAAAAWFEAHKIVGYAWSGGRGTPGGRMLRPAKDAEPLWPRYSSLTTGKPIFGDRDKTIHDDVMELSLERRNGYAWYGGGPSRALKEYAEWKKTH
ncbi:MAG: pectate lyase [Acidobacteriota bacterium]